MEEWKVAKNKPNLLWRLSEDKTEVEFWDGETGHKWKRKNQSIISGKVPEYNEHPLHNSIMVLCPECSKLSEWKLSDWKKT